MQSDSKTGRHKTKKYADTNKRLPKIVAILAGFGTAILCMIVFAFALSFLRRLYPDPDGVHIAIIFFAAFVLLALCMTPCLLSAIPAAVKTKRLYEDLFIARANTADLPAPDSLVRASQESVQAQEGVLLRAAIGETQPGDETQLLRAAEGEQK